MTDAVTPDARSVRPEGVALAIMVVSPTFLVLSVLAVAIRASVRLVDGTFAVDDCLLIGGLVSSFSVRQAAWTKPQHSPFSLDRLVLYSQSHGLDQQTKLLTPCLAARRATNPKTTTHRRASQANLPPSPTKQIFYTADVGLAMHAATVGIGTMDARLNGWLVAQASKYFTIWILVYVVGLALIKSSICTTIWRIASVRRGMAFAVCFLFGLVWTSFIVTFVGMLLYCSPIRANWEPGLVLEGKASCGSVAALIGISHTATVTTILTDIGCAVLPGILLWKTQMKPQAKFEVFALMSVASM